MHVVCHYYTYIYLYIYVCVVKSSEILNVINWLLHLSKIFREKKTLQVTFLSHYHSFLKQKRS